MKRYGNKRDANEKEIIAALESIGCTVFQLDRPVDLLVGYRARNLLLECKGPKGKKTTGQVEFFKAWKGQVRIVTSTEEAIEVVTGCYES